MVQPRVLLVPGLNGSGAGHWQSIWAASRPDAVMVRQSSWGEPWPDAWVETLDAAVAASPAPVILVAHSLGCTTVARWAIAHAPRGVAAALLVAPCDVDRADACAALARFRPSPAAALPFRSTVVVSRNDPYIDLARARCFAHRWGSAVVDAGFAGHINAASGLGDWTFGEVLLDDLIASTVDDRHRRAADLRDRAPAAGPCLPL